MDRIEERVYEHLHRQHYKHRGFGFAAVSCLPTLFVVEVAALRFGAAPGGGDASDQHPRWRHQTRLRSGVVMLEALGQLAVDNALKRGFKLSFICAL